MDIDEYPYLLLTSGNNHFSAFENRCFVADKVNSEPKGNQIVFINYDYRNSIVGCKGKKNNPLSYPDFLAADVEQELPFPKLEYPSNQNDREIPIRATVSRSEYIKRVSDLKQHIQVGNIYEINYCITFEAQDVRIDPLALYTKLNSISKAPYSSLAKIESQFIISSSPELFLSKKANKLFTKPIKGTAKRGQTTEADLKIKNELQQSLKERTENVMIVDVCRNDFSRIATRATVQVEKLFDIESYMQVHQMVSTISCGLKENTSFKQIIDATFPMASMTGAPKIRAMELIDEFEVYNRGPYSGCLGYIDKNGDFDLSVLIRSVFYDKEKRYLSFSVGSAITHLCDPAQEYDECLLKANAMIKALNAKIINC